MFLPTTTEEMKAQGLDSLDIILVTGDAYIDSPFMGVALIGKFLVDSGFTVGVIAQPDTASCVDIERLGEPKLFWGVTGGAIDSMVANRTATGKKRRRDDYTPGGRNERRPDRAVINYANLIRKSFKSTSPIVLGGIEASLRRVAHYDFWSDCVRRSILFDAKADYLLYGMAERAAGELAETLKAGGDPTMIRGLSFVSKERPEGALELPSYEEAAKDKVEFEKMFKMFYDNNDPLTAKTLAQAHGTRYLVQNPPALPLTTAELDRIHDLDFERDAHPETIKDGEVRALKTIRFSISTHRGCYGECGFCAIGVHQGRLVTSRSKTSILKEAKVLTRHALFKGRIDDVGGPTANMYGFECEKKEREGSCKDINCVMPKICKQLPVDHGPQIELLRAIRLVKGVKKAVVASGLRYDMILADKRNGISYLRELVRHHVSGQMKIAPEHSEEHVLRLMQKPGTSSLIKFRELFSKFTKEAGLDQYLTYYLIAAHPGSTLDDMKKLRRFCADELKSLPEQVQQFTPTPSTYSTLIYWTGRDPFTDAPCFVERSVKGREAQKEAVIVKRGPRGPRYGKIKRKTGQKS
ncbi:MAG: YgiQ family radical SAM protein [Thermodesulfobacteriota bacterium]